MSKPSVDWKLVVSVAALVVLAGCTRPQIGGDYSGNGTSQYDRNTNYAVSGLASCGSRNELFNVSPIALVDLTNIVPLGNLNPPGHTFPTDHVYFHVKKVSDGSHAERVDLASPGDVLVFRVSSSERISDSTFTDYSVEFSPCSEVRFKFGHVSSLSEKLNQSLRPGSGSCEEYETGGYQYRYCGYEVMLNITAGEVIGTAGGPGENALDIWAYDFRTPELAYANPSRFHKYLLHISCPLDYFAGGLKENLFGLLGDGRMLRTEEPVCGEAEQDVKGTAQGVWFLKGTKETYPEDPHLALVHDNFDPSRGVFSIGTSTATSGLAAGTYYYVPLHSGTVNRDFAEVRQDGTIYCYEPRDRFVDSQITSTIILIQLTSETGLKIEKQQLNSCGSGPWNLTDKASEFER